MTGNIVRLVLDRGFGFIDADGETIFFNVRDLSPELAWDDQLKERRVEFGTERGPKGLKARNVRPAP